MGLLELAMRALLRDWRTALRAAKRYVSGRAYAARIDLIEMFTPPPPPPDIQYSLWQMLAEPYDSASDQRLRERSAAIRIVAVVNALTGPPHDIEALAGCLAAQTHPPSEVLVVSGPGDADYLDKFATVSETKGIPVRHIPVDANSDTGVDLANEIDAFGDGYICVLQSDERLPAVALQGLADAIVRADAKPALVYSDNDRVDATGHRFDPNFKPDWNRELFYAQDYICGLRLLDLKAVRQAGGFPSNLTPASLYGLALDATANAPDSTILHVPAVLCHDCRPVSDDDRSDDTVARAAALATHLDRVEPGSRVVEGPYQTSHVVRPLPNPAPLVTVIVPTRDQLHLTRKCLDGLLHHTDYPELEVLLVNNDSAEATTLLWFKEIVQDARVRVMDWPGAFNYAAINNDAVANANGSIVALVNNDIEILDGGWLKEMVSIAVRPEIGAVGAKLLYPDGRIQHAGVIAGLGGVADHGHKFFDGDAAGYQCRLQSTQFVAAVTAACLVVEKTKFISVDGLDAKNLAVAFNDVDFCFKLHASGLRNVYTPHAVLVHHESVSRGADMSAEKAARFQREAEFMKKKWTSLLQHDPFYSPHLTRRRNDYSLAME